MVSLSTAQKYKMLQEAMRAQESKLAQELKGYKKEDPADYEPDGVKDYSLDLGDDVEMFKVPGDEKPMAEEDKIDEGEDDFATSNRKMIKQMMAGKEGDALMEFKDKLTKKRKPVESFSYKSKM